MFELLLIFSRKLLINLLFRMSDAVVFGGMLIDSSALLGISIYALITLSDLECDYLNAPTACSKLNSVILVKETICN